MKVVLVANDQSPTDMMKAVARALIARGHEAVLVVGEKPGECRISAMQMREIIRADLVFAGMSSSEELADPELEVLSQAEMQRIPFGLFSDAPGCFKRTWFEEFQSEASFVAVLREDEVVEAQALFPKALVEVTGHPSREIILTASSADEVKRRLALPLETRIVLCCGSKDLQVNNDLLFAVSLAWSSRIPELKSSRIIFCPHPADQNSWATYSRFSGVEIVPPATLSTAQVVAGSSVLVNALSTVYQDAAYWRVPTISLLTETIKQKRIANLGTDRPIEVEEGVAIPVHNVDELIVALKVVLGAGSPKLAAIKENQERFYPKPNAPGTAAKIAAEMMEEVLRKV